MNEQRIEELKNAVREVLQQIVGREESLSNELRNALFQMLSHVENRILELREQETQEPTEGLQPTPEQPDMTQAMPSSNVYGFNYDFPNKRLLIKFQGNGEYGQGPVYAYDGVPPFIFRLFKEGAAIAKTTGKNKWGEWWKGKTPSIGAAMSALIKNGGYAYQKLS